MATTNSSLPTPDVAGANTSLAGQPLTRASGVGRIIKVDDSTGCTLTNASIKGLTPNEFEALSNKEIDLARVIASSAEAQMLGVQERGLTTLLNSSITNIKPLINKVNVAEQSMILPYIQRRQRSVMNANYFTVSANQNATSASAADAAYKIVDADDGDRVLTVDLGASDWASGGITGIERYFLPGGFLIMNGFITSGTDQSAVEVQFKILGSEAVANTISQAKVSVRPVGADITQSVISGGQECSGFTATTWASYTGAEDYEITVGVLQTIANNVNDFEEWCRNQPTDLSVKLIVNWLQTTRESRQVDESYKETLAKIMSGQVNPYLKSMVYQPLAEQNKIAAKASSDQWNRAVWYNQAISDKQTPETYMQLPAVSDPEDANCTLEYKSNALGIKALLRESNRVKDNLGGVLNLESLMADIYYLKRNREQDGSSVSVVDCMTDRFTYNLFYEKMALYYKSKYGIDSFTRNMQLNQQIKHDGLILFNYSLYDLPEVGAQLAMFHDPYFDDLLNVGGKFFANSGPADGGKLYNADGTRSTVDVMGDAAGQDAYQKSARALWFIDWSDCKIGIAGTNAITRKQPHPETDRLYKCRMAHKNTEYSLRSTTWTTMMDVPARHLLIENFDLDLDIST
ncbi:MAG: hypothetical protein CMC82_05985 [Flavobacteriaceae bacterium]|nr:hypothetical protein [Flavobacteriaceae bacterium]